MEKSKKIKLSFNKTTINKLSDAEMDNTKGGLPWWAEIGISILTGPIGTVVSALACTRSSDCDLPTWADPGCPGGGGGR
ncbi:MAG: class I lanthipeptide [Flavobacteriales bacterium]|nr:class I lanthipeptide [Flavobacteriales bacterium]